MMTRRTFLKRALWATAGASYAGVYPALVEPHRVQVSRLRLAIPNLPRALEGFAVAHLTDLHRSPFVSERYLHHCINVANALEPDLIAFTGDYITHGMHFRNQLYKGDINLGDPAEYLDECSRCMGRARAKHGVFASLGNHDHWYDGDRVTSAIEAAGIPVLRNQNVSVNVNGESLPVVGLGDLYTEGVDFQRSFADIDSAFSLVLMHNPDSFAGWSRTGAHLILAGHTHGGQVNIPLLGSPITPSRFMQGIFSHDYTTMYVNRGIGLIFPPLRINCPPEIALIELRRSG
jgi:predicted MPP superfamily phosphohydrolase